MASFATLLTRVMRNSGYEWTLRRDMGAWVEEMRRAPETVQINPTYDPAFSDINHGFWIRVTHGGRVVAIIANRFFEYYEGGDFIDDMKWGRVWWRQPSKYAVVPFDVQPLPMKLTGLIGHHGGLWVDPVHRKQGLSFALPRLVRAITFEQPQPDFHCGNVLGDLAQSTLPLGAYGYARCFPCLTTDYFPPTQKPAQIHVTVITRAEMRDQLQSDAEFLEARKDEQLAVAARDYAAVVATRRAVG